MEYLGEVGLVKDKNGIGIMFEWSKSEKEKQNLEEDAS